MKEKISHRIQYKIDAFIRNPFYVLMYNRDWREHVRNPVHSLVYKKVGTCINTSVFRQFNYFKTL